MAEVLTSEHFDSENCIRSVIGGYRSNVMSTPLDPYFRRRIVMLWKSGENISSIVWILQMEGRKQRGKQ